MKKDYFISHKEAIPVKGYTRSIIYDLPRRKVDFIPNDLYFLIIQNDGNSLAKITSKYKGAENKKVIESYFDFLFEKEYAFLADKTFAKNFPNINLEWDYPAQITNAIVDFSKSKNNAIKKMLQVIENFGCRHVVLYLKESKQLEWVYLCATQSLFQSIEIWLDEKDGNTINFVINFLQDKQHRFVRINIVSSVLKTIKCSTSTIVTVNKNPFKEQLIFEAKTKNFIVNIDFFTEAQKHNPFFNRKLYIDKGGFVKNALEHQSSFGHVLYDDIDKIIKSKKFQKYWTVSKDKIQVCKDCEFRYMCMDSRIPQKVANNQWLVLGECTYNPYIAKWKDEDGYVPVEACGTYTKASGFVPDAEKIAKLNQELWSD
ncbi:MAG: grasp-with-spasm system SPASM domain peptide maturase [Bacteroidales bacterium]|jgi:SPASM domain peptide maturase of grasp-with-spasm system|nr:grasp-with-spasm system SPASM domain peptide maturase [Bacteroidales bacterium]